MPGFESNRFIDLSESVAKHLICSICLNIYENAVRSECEHTFCKSCVQNWIQNNHKECPECREEFVTRKRTNDNRNVNNLVIIGKHVFKTSLKINSMISELTIKCDFDFNGCQQSVQLSQLSAHIKVCEHRFCNNCGFTFGNIEEHNCIELLKNNRNKWKEKYEKQLEINNKLKEENSENKTKLQTNEKTINDLKENYDKSFENVNQNKLKEDIKKLKTDLKLKEYDVKILNKQLAENNEMFKNDIKTIIQKTLEKIPDFCDSSLSFSSNLKKEILQYFSGLLLLAKNFCSTHLSVEFGNFSEYSTVVLEDNIIKLNKITTNHKISKKVNLNLSLNRLQEVMFCRNKYCHKIYLKIDKQICKSIAKSLDLGDNSRKSYRFDVNSKDPKHRYIKIEFNAIKQDLYFDCFLRYIKLREPGIKIQETNV